jgi:hypothetical protein
LKNRLGRIMISVIAANRWYAVYPRLCQKYILYLKEWWQNVKLKRHFRWNAYVQSQKC